MVAGQVSIVGWKQTSPRQIPCKCGNRDTTVPDESVLPGPDGMLRNVVVYLKDAPPLDAVAAAAASAPTLDQLSCRFMPHVIAMHVNQKLRVKNSNPTLHNVHTITQTNPAVNFGMLESSQRDLDFRAPEFIQVKCDVHPWMLAHVAIFDHPFFAVTDEEGRFRIENVPAGTYTVVAWQERLGELQQQVTIAAPATAPATIPATRPAAININFTFRPPP